MFQIKRMGHVQECEELSFIPVARTGELVLLQVCAVHRENRPSLATLDVETTKAK